ncbi:SMC-Scp complex subunit ScpB [Dokdonella immobilis]|uniref:Segregation and condensation protein B n=1 Tax=Dokdonella immobilis TaxID=578942 RepID=A0A1I4VYH0_9GAMM|nr:segregation and condensation protein B [Dokdonella immobilis]
MIEFELLKRIIEAALLASGNPLTPTQLLALFGENEATSHDEIARAIASLQADCDSRGIELVEVASGFRYQVRQDVHPWVARLWTERPSRYSRALLETLALIAYRQPITRAEIEQIRGVAVSTHIVKTLEEREWIRVVGHRDVPGKPALFGTTRGFLDYFGLKSLDELPSLGEIRDIDEFDPQLSLGPPTQDESVAAVSDDPATLAAAAHQAGAVNDELASEADADERRPTNASTEAESPSPTLSASATDAETTEQDA